MNDMKLTFLLYRTTEPHTPKTMTAAITIPKMAPTERLDSAKLFLTSVRTFADVDFKSVKHSIH